VATIAWPEACGAWPGATPYHGCRPVDLRHGVIITDKTGTLTKGMTLSTIELPNGRVAWPAPALKPECL
jgi:hypothetical protein